MDTPAFHAFTAQIAAALGPGWQSSPCPSFRAQAIVRHTDGRALNLGRTSDGRRIWVSGLYPDTDRSYRTGETPETTATLTRSAHAVARQILAERFMGVYCTTLEAVRAHNAKKEAHQAERKRIGGVLHAHVPEGTPWRPVIEYTRAWEKNQESGDYEHTETVHVTLTFNHLTEERARLIMAAYAEGLGHTPGAGA